MIEGRGYNRNGRLCHFEQIVIDRHACILQEHENYVRL
jgi:hypothetical protein